MIRARCAMRALVRTAFVAAFVLLSACSRDRAPGPTSPPAQTQPSGLSDEGASFLKQHWQRPLPAQGTPPSGFGPLEASLAPSACGACHPRQFADWQTTLHSKAMSPGLLGQLQDMGSDVAEQQATCLACHAPLQEQAMQLTAALRTSPHAVPARSDGVSHLDGLTCAGCHVRAHQRFGPPRQDGSRPAPDAPLPHGGWHVETAFEDSRFCAACHQFDDDGLRLDGKLLENTYAEWQASRHAQEGRTCQSCHMPQRRHLWRGIHDPAMVRSGLEISTSTPVVGDGRVSWQVSIANRNVGHAFPTYVVPRVVVEIAQQDSRGEVIAATMQRHLIARVVTLDLSSERADTRILPDEVRRYRYEAERAAGAVAIRLRIVVEPDAFYVDFYRAMLGDADVRAGRAALREALQRAMASPYELLVRQRKFED